MRVVTMHPNGVLQLNFMWLPTFIGQNYMVMRQLEVDWKNKFGGTESTPEVLDQIHDWTINWLCQKFSIEGLERYLRAIELVPMEGNDVSVQRSAG